MWAKTCGGESDGARELGGPCAGGDGRLVDGRLVGELLTRVVTVLVLPLKTEMSSWSSPEGRKMSPGIFGGMPLHVS